MHRCSRMCWKKRLNSDFIVNLLNRFCILTIIGIILYNTLSYLSKKGTVVSKEAENDLQILMYVTLHVFRLFLSDELISKLLNILAVN